MPFSGSSGEVVIDVAAEALAFIQSNFTQVEVLTAMLNERVDANGALVPCVDVSWVIRGRPGLLFVHPKHMAGWPDVAVQEIHFKKAKVEAIYEGLPEAPWLVGSVSPTPINVLDPAAV